MKNIKKISTIFIFINLFLLNFLYCQENIYSIGLWKFTSNSLFIGAEYNLKNQKTNYLSKLEDHWYNSLIGNLRLNSQSYIWNQKLIKLEVDGIWSPNAKVERNVIMPNSNQALTSEKINFLVHLFEKLPVSINYNIGLSHTYQTNDLTTNLENRNFLQGVNLNLKTSFINFSTSYSNSENVLKELAIGGRTFESSSEDISFYTSKSFSSFDNNSLNLSLNQIKTKYSDGINYKNDILYGYLNTNILFTADSKYSLTNNLSYNRNDFKNLSNIITSNFSLNERLNNSTNLNMNLPYNFKFQSNYNKAFNKIDTINLSMDNISSRLEHQLFSSLRTAVEYNFTKSIHTQFDENSNYFSFSMNYNKSIPFGRLFIDYDFRKGNETKNSIESIKNITNEEFKFDDSKIVLLKNASIDISSIEVKNLTGSIIYQKNIDYSIINHGYFLELKRIPGGQIKNNELVYVNYLTRDNSSYKYDVAFNYFNFKLNLFSDLLELYFRLAKNEYSNKEVNANKFLQIVDSKIYGLSSNYANTFLGLEYENNNTNLMPFESYRINSNFNHYFTNSFSLYILGNISKTIYKENNDNFDFGTLNCRINYTPSYVSIYSLEAAYNLQKSNLYNLNYFTLKSEWERSFNNFSFKIRYETYYRINENDNLLHNGLSIKIERKI